MISLAGISVHSGPWYVYALLGEKEHEQWTQVYYKRVTIIEAVFFIRLGQLGLSLSLSLFTVLPWLVGMRLSH